MKVICSCCLIEKDSIDFYNNAKKINGLDSQCKACILKRKSSKYKKTSLLKKKTKALRKDKKCSVLDVGSCSVTTRRLNSIYPELQKILSEELVRGILWQLRN